MKIKNQTISSNWNWSEIEIGEVLIISAKRINRRVTALVVDTSYEIFSALDDAGISGYPVLLDLENNTLFLADTNDYIIISRFKEPEVELGGEFIKL